MVSFIHHELVNELERELFKRWICSDRNLREFIIASILIRNNKVLLVGFPGTGKSTLIRLIAKALSKDVKDAKRKVFGIAIGAPEKTLQKVLVSTDIVKLLTTGEEVILVRPIVSAKIKFINEINRFSKSVQDALLSMLEEGYLEYGGAVFRTPEYICFADMNPFRGDIDRALKTRFWGSCYIDFPDLGGSSRILRMLMESESETSYPDVVRTMPEILSLEELKEVWLDVMKVEVPEIVKIFTLMLVSMFRVCKYGRSLVGYMRLKCTDCEYSNEPCALVQEPPDERANIAMLSYARARAWLKRRSYVVFEDVVWAAPFVLAHRVEFRPLVKSRAANPWELVRQIVSEIQNTKLAIDDEVGSWLRALGLVCVILKMEPIGKLKDIVAEINKAVRDELDALKELEKLAYGEFGRGDLVIQQLYGFVRDEL